MRAASGPSTPIPNGSTCRAACRGSGRRTRSCRPRTRSFSFTRTRTSSAWCRPTAASTIRCSNMTRSFNGLAVGCWEGDTLVVTSMGFTDRTWLHWSGYIHSNEMTVIERLRRQGDTLIYQATVEDPVMFLQPWTMDDGPSEPEQEPRRAADAGRALQRQVARQPGRSELSRLNGTRPPPSWPGIARRRRA